MAISREVLKENYLFYDGGSVTGYSGIPVTALETEQYWWTATSGVVASSEYVSIDNVGTGSMIFTLYPSKVYETDTCPTLSTANKVISLDSGEVFIDTFVSRGIRFKALAGTTRVKIYVSY